MKRQNWLLALGMAVSLLPAAPALAADHLDGAAVKEDGSTDLNDVYSWMSADKSKTYLAMTAFPAADKTTAKFSNAAYYVFHTNSRASAVVAADVKVDVICSFDAAQKISCWIGSTDFVSGDASAPAGLANASGSVKVFAGVRKDHFFFNLAGFNDTRAAVKAALLANMVTFGMAATAPGCPTATVAGYVPTLATISGYLGKTVNGTMAAVDFFKTLNTLAIVLEIDTALLNKGGPILGVYAATHRKG